ncbi:P1 family peptidase [Henriciella pelagia]|jgi:L-aminopeptidase/D-esterase-like protein|uniref:Peptidase T4 n=1 Tax=Henriciella pelagia TaxID=1977912 RepID=A0ABQ1JY47_9PROT|nr:P1 family peptidase [Henriciella pelagia]GGB77701.1 peptidase T4 [Henriciella pelagia]
MSRPGPRNLITDVDGIQVGNAEDFEALTGTTVILADEPVTAACAVAGGGPGTRETDLLRADTMVEQVDAVVLSGGSAYGLAAADGVCARLGAMGRGYGLKDLPGVPKTPIVPSAILYDLANGGKKDWGQNPPYRQLGEEAFENHNKHFGLGNVGCGIGANAGAHAGGLGSASLITNDGITIGAVAGVNCFGSVFMPNTTCFWAWPFEIGGEFGGHRPPEDYECDPEEWGDAKMNPQPGQNTTIACIATDVDLNPAQAHRVAQMALSGFSRAIRPVFAPFDGDALFVISTGKVKLEEPTPIALTRIGELAASTLARAIARGVYEADQKVTA